MRTCNQLVVAAALALLCSCAAFADSPSSATTGAASRTTDFALRDIAGKTVRLSDYRGRVVVVNFWATWCSPCAAEQPQLEKLWKSYRDRGVVVLAVSMDGPETVADVAPMVHARGLTFPVLLDVETAVTGNLNPRRAAPYTLLIGKDGVVTWQKESYAHGDAEELEGQVQRLL